MTTFNNLRDAVLTFNERGVLQDIDRDVIMTMMSFKDDKHLLASWEVYQVLHDEDDLLETLQILADVKRREEPNTYGQQALMMSREQPRQATVPGQLMPSSTRTNEMVLADGSRNGVRSTDFAPRSIETSSFERDANADPISLNTRAGFQGGNQRQDGILPAANSRQLQDFEES